MLVNGSHSHCALSLFLTSCHFSGQRLALFASAPIAFQSNSLIGNINPPPASVFFVDQFIIRVSWRWLLVGVRSELARALVSWRPPG